MEPARATPRDPMGTEATEAAQKETDYGQATPPAASRPRGCVTSWSRVHQSKKLFKKKNKKEIKSRHLFSSQEVFFTFNRARCLPLLARAWLRSVYVRPQ